MDPQDWRKSIATAREAEGLSQLQLADAAGVSLGTVKAYEQGRRHPSRPSLAALLDALKLDRGQRNQILTDAGFAPDEQQIIDQHPGYYFSETEARTEIEARPWPAALVDELMEVRWANGLLQRLWNVDLRKELNSPVERNILSVISLPRFQGRLLNRDECISIALGILKGHHLGPETEPLGSSPYFQAVIQHFMSGDPTLVARLFELWGEAQPRPYKARGIIPIRWRDPSVGEMRFEILLNSANEPAGLAFHDWIPTDAATWQALEAIRRR